MSFKLVTAINKQPICSVIYPKVPNICNRDAVDAFNAAPT